MGAWAWGLERAAVAFGCRKAVPFGQLPIPSVSFSPGNCIPFSIRPHLPRFRLAALLRFLSRTQLVAQRFIAPGAPGCYNAAPFCSVPHPSASLSSQNYSRISFRPYLSISLRFTSSVCLSEAIGLTGVLCAWVFECCDAAPFGQFPTRVALSPRKSTLGSPSDRNARSPLASLPRFAPRRQLGARGVDYAGVFGCCDVAPFAQFPTRVALSLFSQKHARISCRPPLSASCRRTYSVGGSWAHGAVDYGRGVIGGAATQPPPLLPAPHLSCLSLLCTPPYSTACSITPLRCHMDVRAPFQ